MQSITLTFATLVVLFAVPVPAADDATNAAVLAPYEQIAESAVDPHASEALARIDGVGRRLLAARSYLRSASSLPSRWSWTDDQIRAFEGSDDQRALQAAIDRVRQTFEVANPGYTLFVNQRVRSLDEQIRQWNRNETVAAAAAGREAATRAAVSAHKFAPRGGDPRRAFLAFLTSYPPRPTPTIAAPGLSPHGRMLAVDFHVRRGTDEIAGPEASSVDSVWIAQGWTDKLRAAVTESEAPFRGPLDSPREPWHYDYAPACQGQETSP